AVPREEGEEARLGAGRPLDPAAAQGRQAVADLVEVEEEVLQPEAGPFADGGQLGRLEVGVGEGRDVLGAAGEGGQLAGGRGQPGGQQLQGLPHQQDVGVVGDEGAGGADVEDPPGPGVDP